MNDYSLNETASRARLAAKGAGYHWGQADEVYRAVFWLVERDFPALLLLKGLLECYKSSGDVRQGMPYVTGADYRSQGAFQCPIQLGCALTDSLELSSIDSEITFENVKNPLLMLPFIAELAIKFARGVVVHLDSEQFSTDGTHVRFSSTNVPQLNNVETGKLVFENLSAFEFDGNESMQLHTRAHVAPTLWQALDVLAHRTYAPASEASRLLGAGAGVQDND